MLMVLSYGKGRIFHTTMGHDLAALNCVGFMTTYQRGAEWAATGKVTLKVPPIFRRRTRPVRERSTIRRQAGRRPVAGLGRHRNDV
jgi:type 1 glutamine amidotransferase